MSSRNATQFAAALVLCVVCAAAYPIHPMPFGGGRGRSLPIPPNCPPRPPVPAKGAAKLPQNLIDAVVAMLRNNTMGPCTAGAHVPSATALSGGFVVGGTRYDINEGCVSKETPTVRPSSNKTIYRLGSMSKTFVAEAVLDAYRAKKIRSLDDEVREYFPEFYIKNPFDNTQPTWRQMASQLAGMPSEPPCKGLPDCNVTADEVLRRLRRDGELIFPPGGEPSYSNVAFGVLGALLPKLWGPNETYPDYIRNVTALHGMGSTGIVFTPEVKARMAVEYTAGGQVAQWTHLGFEDPSGGVYSTGEDMLTWAEHYLADWKRSPMRKQLLQPMYLNGDGKTGFGMPWEIISSNGYLVRTKAGALSGVSTVIGLIPELDFAFVLLWNGEGFDSTDAAQAVADMTLPYLIDDYSTHHLKHFPVPSANFTDHFVGNYSAGGGLHFTVAIANEKKFYGRPVVHMSILQYGIDYLLRPAPGGDGLSFQIDVRRRTMPCMQTEISNDGNWVYFSRDANGNQQLFMPGVEYYHYPMMK